jgi:hypothetical protein
MDMENEAPSERTTQLVRAAIKKALLKYQEQIKPSNEEEQRGIEEAIKWVEKIDAEEKSRQR